MHVLHKCRTTLRPLITYLSIDEVSLEEVENVERACKWLVIPCPI